MYTVTEEFFTHADWLRVKINQSTDHGNDLMVAKFVFLFLAHAVF